MCNAITVSGFREMIRAGQIRPGDLVCFRNGERGILNWLIRRSQARMLRDLDPDMAADVVTWASEFTHVGAVDDAIDCAEMYWPRARFAEWSDKLSYGLYPGDGTRILVRRPQVFSIPLWAPSFSGDITAALGEAIADQGHADVQAKTPYPVRELLTYYLWSWHLQKLMLGRHFVDVFTAESTDVCSGRYWLWCRRAGCFPDAIGTTDDRPEAWYPARLAVSARFRTIGEYEISSAPAGATSPPFPSTPPAGAPISVARDGAAQGRCPLLDSRGKDEGTAA